MLAMGALTIGKGLFDYGEQKSAQNAAERAQAEQRKQDSIYNLQSLLTSGTPQRAAPITPLPTTNFGDVIPDFSQLAAMYQMNQGEQNTQFGQDLARDRYDVEKLYRDALTDQANASTELTRAKIANPELYRSPSIYDLIQGGGGGGINFGGGQPTPQTGPVFGGVPPSR